MDDPTSRTLASGCPGCDRRPKRGGGTKSRTYTDSTTIIRVSADSIRICFGTRYSSDAHHARSLSSAPTRSSATAGRSRASRSPSARRRPEPEVSRHCGAHMRRRAFRLCARTHRLHRLRVRRQNRRLADDEAAGASPRQLTVPALTSRRARRGPRRFRRCPVSPLS